MVDFPMELVAFASPRITFRPEWNETTPVRNFSERISISIGHHSGRQVDVDLSEDIEHIERQKELIDTLELFAHFFVEGGEVFLWRFLPQDDGHARSEEHTSELQSLRHLV